MTGFPVLERSSLAAIADLCRRGISDSPTLDELDGTLFAAEQPAIVRGDPDVGVVATVDCDDGAHVRLIVVDPSCGVAVMVGRCCALPKPTPELPGAPR